MQSREGQVLREKTFSLLGLPQVCLDPQFQTLNPQPESLNLKPCPEEESVCMLAGAMASLGSLLGPVDPSFRELSGRVNFTVQGHKFSKDASPLAQTQWSTRLFLTTVRYSSRLKNNFADMCSGSDEGSYLRLIGLCITQLQARESYGTRRRRPGREIITSLPLTPLVRSAGNPVNPTLITLNPNLYDPNT